jgi:Flp pilus assembly pilin Flp
MKSSILRFIRNESGATVIEWDLIVAGISVTIIGVARSLEANFTLASVSNALK